MNNTLKSKKSEKQQTDTSSFSRILKPQKQMLVGNGKLPGVGLWCIDKTQVDHQEPSKANDISLMSIDSKFENETLNQFEEETYNLNKEVENSYTRLTEARTEIIFLKKQSQDLIMKISETKTKILKQKHFEEEKKVEAQDLTSKIQKNQEDCEKFKYKLQKITAEMDQMNQDQEDSEVNHQQKNDTIEYLKEQVFDLEEENEELETKYQQKKTEFQKLQNQSISLMLGNLQIRDLKHQLQNETDAKLGKITQLTSNSQTLFEKNSENESLRKRNFDKNQQFILLRLLEKELTLLRDEKQILEVQNNNTNREIIRLQNQKTSNNKQLEDKIKSQVLEIEKLKKEIQDKSKKIQVLKKKQAVKEGYEDEIIEDIQAKPFLFGPGDQHFD